MKQESIIKANVTDWFRLVIKNEDDCTTKVWKLCYDYPAIAAVEESTGIDLKKIDGWKSISSGKDFPKIIHGGLHRYNPEVTLDDVLNFLNPAVQRELSDKVFELCFPGVVEAFKKQQELENATGETADPNVVTVPQTV